MKNVIFAAAFLIALFFELAAGGKLALWGVRPPLAASVLFFWFWDTRFYPRLFFAFLGGIILDSISIHPFGTNTAVFMALAGNTGALCYFFSNVESFATRAVGVFINIFLSVNLAVFMGYLVGATGDLRPVLTPALLSHVLFASLIWAAALPSVFLLLAMAGKFVYEKVKTF